MPIFDEKSSRIVDAENGRDHTRGFDSNTKEKNLIIDDILERVDGIDKEKLKRALCNWYSKQD